MPDATTDQPAESDEDEEDVEELIDRLEELHDTVDAPHERSKVASTLSLVHKLSTGRVLTERVRKYTTRDMAESLVGGIIFSLPLLVEDGVFDIAQWFVDVRVGGIPVLLVANAALVIVITTGLMYYAQFREVEVVNPLFGVIPRRLVGVLGISLVVAAGSMALWGRLEAGDPTTLETIARIAVVWTPAAFGGALGDILPGESTGPDVSEYFD